MAGFSSISFFRICEPYYRESYMISGRQLTSPGAQWGKILYSSAPYVSSLENVRMKKKFKERVDFGSVWSGSGWETYEAIITASTLRAPPRMPGMP